MTLNSPAYNQPCRLCGSHSLELFYKQGNADEYRFYRCRDCQLVNYDLATGLNQEKYAEEFYDPRDESLRINQLKHGIFQALRKHAQPPASILEIGCGSGRLLYLAQRSGFQVAGLELSPFLAESVRTKLGIPVESANFLTYRPQSGTRYDVVILQHVLEHLPDCIAAMESIRELLLPNGIGLMEFPNIDGWDLAFKRTLRRTGLRRRKYPENYKPGHVNEFCRQSFERLAQKTGFRLDSWRAYSNKPLGDFLYRWLPIGNKVRVVVRKTA